MKLKHAVPAKPEYQLRHRLTGAVILVTLAVVVIPLLLSEHNLPARQYATPTTQSTETTYRAPIEPATDTKTKSANGESKLGKTKESATSPSGWGVRVGTFSERKNADSVSALLVKNGFKVQKTRVKTAAGKDATRIWLGPYAQQKTANTISDRIKALIGEHGFVIKHQP